jgi:outer membrane protein
MNARRVSSLSVVAVALLLAAAPAFAQVQPTKIGVVNLKKVFDTVQEVKDLRAKLEADQASYNSEAQKDDAEIKDLQQKLNNGPKVETTQYDDLARQIEEKTVQYKMQLDMKKIEMARNMNKQLKSIFDKIETSVGDIAKNKGLDLVITEVRPELPADVRNLNPDALQNLIGQRNVLFKSDKIDITTDVVAALDAKYKSGGK